MNQINQTIGEQVGAMLGHINPEGQDAEVETLEGNKEGSSDEEAENQKVEEEKTGEEEEVSEGTADEVSGEGEKEEEDEGSVNDEETVEKTPVELEMEALRKQNELLQAQLNEVAGKHGAPEAADTTPEILEVGEDFIDLEDDLEALFSDHKRINATLKKTASKAANVALEHVFKKLPTVITKIVQDEVANYRQADQFFVDNKDLMPHREFVSYVYKEMVAKDPKTSPLDHFKGLAKEVRRRIGSGLQPQTNQHVDKGKKTKRRSNFNPPGGKPMQAPAKPTGIGAEINAMLKV